MIQPKLNDLYPPLIAMVHENGHPTPQVQLLCSLTSMPYFAMEPVHTSSSHISLVKCDFEQYWYICNHDENKAGKSAKLMCLFCSRCFTRIHIMSFQGCLECSGKEIKDSRSVRLGNKNHGHEPAWISAQTYALPSPSPADAAMQTWLACHLKGGRVPEISSG